MTTRSLRRSLLKLGRLSLVITTALPLWGFASIEALFAPKAELWERWQNHDGSSSATIDHGAWSVLLGRYLVADGSGLNRFDYAGVAEADRAALQTYIDGLAALPISSYSRPEQQAYWINLYNALTVALILEHYPVDSIRDIDISPGLFADGPWDKALVEVEGEALSLNDIEHRILRPIWRDPRIHYAVNCASVGCPNLLPEAFTSERLEAQLDGAARAYINNPRGARVEDGKLVVSSIYVWFAEDFGGNDAGVIAHLKRYADQPLAEHLKGQKAIADHGYDWDLNEAGRARRTVNAPYCAYPWGEIRARTHRPSMPFGTRHPSPMANCDSYVICTSPRSGSTLLCKLLARTGVAGNPASYFHRPSIAAWFEDLDLTLDESASERDALNTILRAAIAQGSLESGVFGLRLQRHSFDFFIRKLSVLHPRTASDAELFRAAFGRTVFIHLTRRDKVEQAVSYWKADQTGLWHRAPDGTELERLSPPREPVYDAEEIRARFDEVTALDRGWESWFAAEEIAPFRITYDRLSGNPLDTLRNVLDYLGLERQAANGVTPEVAKLADATSHDWAARFRSEQNVA